MCKLTLIIVVPQQSQIRKVINQSEVPCIRCRDFLPVSLFISPSVDDLHYP
jgi:hypothetical protein